MGDCNRCRESIGSTDAIKCDGVCGKVYHITCAGPGKGISKTFYNTFVENDYFQFLCSACRVSSMKNVRDTMDKMLNMLIICDERLNRQSNDMTKLRESNEEIKILIYEKGKNINEMRNEINEDSKVCSGMNGLKTDESNNTDKIIKVMEEVKGAIKSNEIEIKLELQKTRSMSVNKVKTSFADKLKGMVNEPMVIVTPKAGHDNKKTKDDLKSMIDPASLQINHSRNLSNGGIAIACTSLQRLKSYRN